MAMRFGTVIDRITQHIEQRGHHWVLAGGLAMQAHGLSRTTQDLDLVVDAAAQSDLLAFGELADIQHLMRQAGVDRTRVRRYFESAGLLDRFDELLRIL